MTSFKQIEANRRNALKSTGPRTEDGKHNASQNAIRHGLTAETVVEPLEDPEDYKAFEQAVAASYEAESAVERELILRLASLLWRLRRATSIETGLLTIKDEIPVEREPSPLTQSTSREGLPLTALFRLRKRAIGEPSDKNWNDRRGSHQIQNDTKADLGPNSVTRAPNIESDVARRFLRVAKLDNAVFERLGRYESSLWRQVRQLIFTLEGLRWRNSLSARPSQHYWRRVAEATSE